MRAICVTLFILLLAISPCLAQKDKSDLGEEKEIVLEFKTQLVVVPFSITDRTNRPVVDLKAEEIKLLENGKPAQIVSMQRTGNEALNFALLLDLSGSMEPHLPAARTAAARFFDRALKPNKDSAAIVAFQQEIVLTQGLTKDKSALNQALSRKYLALPIGGSAPVDGNNRRLSGTALYGAIYVAVDEVLQSVSGHRVIVLISDGYDSESGIELRDALDYAWRREVTIYAIGFGNQDGLNREVLERLCSATGGRVFYTKSPAELDDAFKQIDEDLRQQFVLSFYPTEQALDTFRTIKIEIPSRPSLDIRHRFGYYNAVVDR